jgi:hypothetical protein
MWKTRLLWCRDHNAVLNILEFKAASVKLGVTELGLDLNDATAA